jgi:hypothetical protein
MITSDVPEMPIDLAAVERRADGYWRRCGEWTDASPRGSCEPQRAEAGATVDRLSAVVKVEVRRALAERAEVASSRPADLGDAYASAATALIAIEQSRRAWLALVRAGWVRPIVAQPFVCDLVWLRHELERAFPGMRLFSDDDS